MFEREKPTTDNFSDQLSRAITMRIDAGIAGIPKFNPANPAKPDYSNVVTRNYWMDDNVAQLGRDIAERNKELDPNIWAACMMCADLMPSQYGVKINFPNAFRKYYAQSKVGYHISEYYKQSVIYGTCPLLKKRMCG